MKDKEKIHESKKLSYQIKSLLPAFVLIAIVVILNLLGFDVR